MNLNYIKSFYYVAKLGSISKAANFLSLAQPTVTKKLQLLEDEMGEPLVQRTARGAKLTERGRELYSHAGKVIEQIEALERQFFQPSPDAVTITTTQGIGACLLPKTLASLNDRSFSVEIVMASDISLDFLENTDVYLGPFMDDLLPSHTVNHLHDFEFSFYASRDYLKEHGTPKNSNDLKSHHLIAFTDERRDAFFETDLSFLLTQPEFQNPFVKTKSAFAELEVTKHGAGVALLSDVGVKHFQTNLERLDLEDFTGLKTPAYAFTKKDIGRDKASFIQKLYSSFQDDLRQLSLKA